MVIGLTIPVTIVLLFIHIIATKMKTTFNDIAITLFGICYIIGFIVFIPLLYAADNGQFLIWYILIAAWGTDTFAYIIGMKCGKHKFSIISPKKSIEGSIAGIVGAVAVSIIYTAGINHFTDLYIAFWYIAVVTLILSIFSQIGDLAASSIKRYADIKDFGELLPGHGGILDRIDSIIFIAPFAYFLLLGVM